VLFTLVLLAIVLPAVVGGSSLLIFGLVLGCIFGLVLGCVLGLIFGVVFGLVLGFVLGSTWSTSCPRSARQVGVDCTSHLLGFGDRLGGLCDGDLLSLRDGLWGLGDLDCLGNRLGSDGNALSFSNGGRLFYFGLCPITVSSASLCSCTTPDNTYL
jgi:hypothetical protein